MNKNDPNQKKTRQKYSPQFKDQAVERTEKDGVPQVAKDLGIPESMLYYWRAQKNKSGHVLHERIEVRYGMIQENKKDFSIKMMCRLLFVSSR